MFQQYFSKLIFYLLNSLLQTNGLKKGIHTLFYKNSGIIKNTYFKICLIMNSLYNLLLTIKKSIQFFAQLIRYSLQNLFYKQSKNSDQKIQENNQMGIGGFGSKQQIFQKGQNFRDDLHQRVKIFADKYRNQFSKIDKKLKQNAIMRSASQLVLMLEKRQVTSYQLVLIFTERTSKIGIQNNYVFDQMFEEAVSQAIQCDKNRSNNPKKFNWKGDIENKEKCFPPFYGIPASYKQNIRFKGRVTHVGFIIPHEKNYPPQQNGLFAQLTIKMGFIPFVRTNMPMSGKTSQTNNNIFGYAKNPWNQQRSCGGSSGGQGGLIGSYCSPIGFGTDIGGSLRIPSQFNGLVTLKSGGRFSKMGNCFYGKISGGTPLKADIGPMTRSVEDIKLFMKFICDQSNYEGISKTIMDPYLNLKPFSQNIFVKKPKLKLGYLTNLQTVSCSPSHARVVKQAVEILRSEGHYVKQIRLPAYEQLYFGMIQMYLAEGSTEALDQLSFGQPLIQQFKLLKISTKIPNFIKNLIIWAVQNKEPRMAKILSNTKALTVGETFTRIHDMLNQTGSAIYKDFISNQVDALIMPGFASPSYKLGTANKFQYCLSYTAGWNVVNYPAGFLPMGVVQENQQYYEDAYNDSITGNIKDCLKQSKGLPVGIQVVSLPFKQEEILYLMSTIEKKVQFRQKHPCENILKRNI